MKALLLVSKISKIVFVVVILLTVFTQFTSAQSIYIDHVDNIVSDYGDYVYDSVPDSVLLAGQTHRIYLTFDLSSLTSYYWTTNCWLFYSPDGADWGGIKGYRDRMLLRTFGDPIVGTLGLGMLVQNMYWHKIGGSGDPNFGETSAAIKEPSPNIRPGFVGPSPGNISGTDTVGWLIDVQWEPGLAGGQVDRAFYFEFTTSEADIGKHICIDSVSQPLGAWEWARVGGASISPAWDGPRCFVIRSCCQGMVGDANMTGGEPSVGDIATIQDLLYESGRVPPCVAEGDANQSGGVNPLPADLTVGDMADIIDYLFGSGTPLPDCY